MKFMSLRKSRIMVTLIVMIIFVFTSSFSVFALPYTETNYDGVFPLDTNIEYYDYEDYLVEGDGPLIYMIPSSDPDSFIITGCGDNVKSIINPEVFTDKTIRSVHCKDIAVGAFKDKNNLTTLVLGNSLKTLHSGVIENCPKLETVSLCDEMTTIEERAIVNCGLTHIALPYKLSMLDPNAFEGCTDLLQIEVASGNKHFKAVNNHIFSLDMSTMVMYGPYDSHKYSNDEVLYNVPDGVRNIGEKCFINCDINKLVLPDTVETIAANAISGDYIESVYIPSSVTSIAADAIPDDVTIHCPEGSYAEQFAESNGNEVTDWDEDEDSALLQQTINIGNKLTSLEYDANLNFNLTATASTRLTYSSSNEDVAYVSSQGKVSVRGVGTATIRVDAAKTEIYNSASESFVLNVTPGKQTITGGASSYSKYLGASRFNLGLKAKTLLNYHSNDINVAKVDSSGNVSIINPGRATISVTTAKSSLYSSASKKINITVSMAKPKLTAKGGKKKVKLTWTKVNGASGYKVYCYNAKKKKYTLRVTKNSTIKSVTHKGLKRHKKYKYYVKAFRKSNGVTYYSPKSKIITAKTT